jgi:broad specificity phosphatase PhoE
MRPPTKRRATLFLVRHGETEGQSSIRYYGRTDVPLSELGRAQMKAVRDALERRHGAPRFTAVFASPLSRALEGARLIADTRADIVTIDEFIEVDFGLFEGLTAEEIRARHPEEFKRWNANRLAADYAYPGGESRAAFSARVARGVERMLDLLHRDRDTDDGTALVVAHRGVIRAIARSLAGVDPAIELASISILRHEGRWLADLLDSTDHLAQIPS